MSFSHHWAGVPYSIGSGLVCRNGKAAGRDTNSFHANSLGRIRFARRQRIRRAAAVGRFAKTAVRYRAHDLVEVTLTFSWCKKLVRSILVDQTPAGFEEVRQ